MSIVKSEVKIEISIVGASLSPEFLEGVKSGGVDIDLEEIFKIVDRRNVILSIFDTSIDVSRSGHKGEFEHTAATVSLKG